MSPTSSHRLATAARYALVVGVPVLALLAILAAGASLHPGPAIESAPVTATAAPSTPVALPDIALLLTQILAILLTARVFGFAMRAMGQPHVVGEMLAGVALGPSLLGWALPGASARLFPVASLGFLQTLSQVGLIVFMFVVGLELDLKLVRERGRAAVLASHASIAVPLVLGAGLALVLYPRLAPAGVPFTVFALFMGAAMSVTAFPVLARILAERRLMQTPVGAVAIACAAVDDVSAWCLLAGVVALVRAGQAGVPVWLTVAGSAAFAVFMLTLGRRALRSLESAFQRRGRITQDLVAVIVLAVLASAWITERLGVHALFGAFLTGAAMPRDRAFVRALLDRFEDGMVVFLLPLFFAFTGLRTSVGLIASGSLWMFCGLIVLAAVVGKMGGAAIAARWAGMGWRESTALGALMNTRGLMELVIVSIGLDIGVLSRPLFAMMVVMTLVTTVMTTPLVAWLYPSPAAPSRAPVTSGAVAR